MRTVVAPVVVEQATVYRAVGGRRYFSRAAALGGYAKAKFRKKHPCECEQADYSDGYGGYNCHVHDLRDRVLPRYVRLLKRLIRGGGRSTPARQREAGIAMAENDDEQARTAYYDRVIAIMEQIDALVEETGNGSYLNAEFDAGFLAASSALLREQIDPEHPSLKAYWERRLNQRLVRVVRCLDGCHVSATRGYGHQKCIHCGLIWDFSPPPPPAHKE